MAYATDKDVEVSLMRELTASEREYVDQLLNRAEAIIKTQVPDLENHACTNFADVLIAVEAESVARVFRNPSAYRQETEGNYSYTLNYQVASGLLDILETEWQRLGVDKWGVEHLRMDGYARARYRYLRPDLRFQYGWPADHHLSEVIEYGYPT